jgi:hypothetical protein
MANDKNKKFTSNKDNVVELLFRIFGVFIEGEEFYSRLGNVVSVDEGEKTAKVKLVNGEDIDDVRLQQVASDTGIFIKPSVNSAVLVAFTDKTTAYLAMYSQIDEIIFQNGANGGLIKIVEQTAKINELNSKYNDLVQRLLTWVPVPGDGGAALKTILTTPTPIQQNPTFNKDDFENVKFKH